ncbi:hypothetical protein B0H13DRAFT_2341947 [Mycena leptocephala]|nr:hypothetical protein B0H13DRAFT_2341947 [Mycena leptocephala]
MSSCALSRVYAFTLPWGVMPASSAHGPSCLRKRNACLRCLLSVPPCSSLLRVLLAASDLLRSRNTETTASSWTRTTCGACNGRPLLSFCILPRVDIPVSTSCTYRRLMLHKIVLGSGSGSDDRAVGRKRRVRATAPARSPSSLLSPSVLCPCPSILSSSPNGIPSQRGFLGLACAIADCGGIRVFIYSQSPLEGLLHHLCVLTSPSAHSVLHTLSRRTPRASSALTFSAEATRATDPSVAHASSIESPQLASLGHADDLPRWYVSRSSRMQLLRWWDQRL